MREIQVKLKEVTNKIELTRELITDQLESGNINKINFDDLIDKLKESEKSLEEIKSVIAEKLNDWLWFMKYI